MSTHPLRVPPELIPGLLTSTGTIGVLYLRGSRCQPGDTLWVREPWRPHLGGSHSRVEYPEGPSKNTVDRDAEALIAYIKRHGGVIEFAGASRALRHTDAWVPASRMPRWASRITLRVTAVSHVQVHALTEADAVAAGFDWVAPHWPNPRDVPDREEGNAGPLPLRGVRGFALDNFRRRWDADTRSDAQWATNPTATRVTF